MQELPQLQGAVLRNCSTNQLLDGFGVFIFSKGQEAIKEIAVIHVLYTAF